MEYPGPQRVGRSLLLVSTLSACGPSLPEARSPALPPEFSTVVDRCDASRRTAPHPLVTELPASEKAQLEGLMSERLLAVEYEGCSLRVVRECNVPGGYVWRQTTAATDTLDLRSADELYARLPIGAAGLEGELARSGNLAVQTTVVGQMRASAAVSPHALPEGCASATHFVEAVSVGAFKLLSGAQQRSRGGIDAGVASVSAEHQSNSVTLREAGDALACASSTRDAPDPQCASPIQVFLQPLRQVLGPAPGSPGAVVAPPPGEPSDAASVGAPGELPLRASAVAGGAPQDGARESSAADDSASNPAGDVSDVPGAESGIHPRPVAVGDGAVGETTPPPPSNTAAPRSGGAPPGITGVYVRFPKPEGDERWTLRGRGGDFLCTLPCGAWVEAMSGTYVQREEPRAEVSLPAVLPHRSGSQVWAEFQPERGSPDLSKWTFYVLGAPSLLMSAIVLSIGTAEAISGCDEVDPISGEEDCFPGAGFYFSAGAMYGAIGGASLWWWLWSQEERFETYEDLDEPRPGGLQFGFGPTGIFGRF